MGSQGPTPSSATPGPGHISPSWFVPPPAARRKNRYWLHLLLLAITVVTTTAVGARMAENFAADRPVFSPEDMGAIIEMGTDPSRWLAGLPFSITLLGILLTHEFGHYIACWLYRIDASLPYFIPAPTLIGTFGAFIRIRSPIYTKRALFDVGIAGPIAGLVVMLPALAIGLAYSKVIPGIADSGELVFGVPLLESLMAWLVFPGTPASDIYLHPIARAAWVGALATALNLLPIGQLDGGHILYSFVGKWHRRLSRLFVLALVPLGLFGPSGSRQWLVWAALLFFLGTRHPSIQDATPLGPGRRKLAILALLVFLLCFTVAPVRLADGF